MKYAFDDIANGKNSHFAPNACEMQQIANVITSEKLKLN